MEMIDAGKFVFPAADLDYVEFEAIPGEGIWPEVWGRKRKNEIGPKAIINLKPYATLAEKTQRRHDLCLFETEHVAILRASLGLSALTAPPIVEEKTGAA